MRPRGPLGKIRPASEFTGVVLFTLLVCYLLAYYQCMSTSTPNLLQRIAYAYGRRLPDSMHAWVTHDLAGDGAVRRQLIRAAVPAFLVLAPFWLLPASLYVHFEMTAPIFVWVLLMSLALNKVWRRYRLAQHDLDPNLVDTIKRRKQARMHEDYIRRYGPRPETAKWQSNSSPF
jgi:hypothetical protein